MDNGTAPHRPKTHPIAVLSILTTLLVGCGLIGVGFAACAIGTPVVP